MRMTNARITIDALATKIGEILADRRPEKFTDADGVDEMKQTIVSVMNKIGWPEDGVPGVRPHIYKMLEDNKIKTLSTFNGSPPNSLQNVETNPANWDLSLDDAKIICNSLLADDEIEIALSCDLYGLTKNGGDYTIQYASGRKLTVKKDSYLELKQSFNKMLHKGQYTLSDAAMAIELHTKAEAKVTVKNLIKAVKKEELKMYDPITNQRYQYGKGYNLGVRDLEEVTTYSELNNWLDENEPLLNWRFPEPQSSDNRHELTNKPAIATKESSQDADDEFVKLFDPVGINELEKMFSTEKWELWADKAKANGLVSARVGRSKFNPYLAALWMLNKKNPRGFDLAKCQRILANNLPTRNKWAENLIKGEQ